MTFNAIHGLQPSRPTFGTHHLVHGLGKQESQPAPTTNLQSQAVTRSTVVSTKDQLRPLLLKQLVMKSDIERLISRLSVPLQVHVLSSPVVLHGLDLTNGSASGSTSFIGRFMELPGALKPLVGHWFTSRPGTSMTTLARVVRHGPAEVRDEAMAKLRAQLEVCFRIGSKPTVHALEALSILMKGCAGVSPSTQKLVLVAIQPHWLRSLSASDRIAAVHQLAKICNASTDAGLSSSAATLAAGLIADKPDIATVGDMVSIIGALPKIGDKHTQQTVLSSALQMAKKNGLVDSATILCAVLRSPPQDGKLLKDVLDIIDASAEKRVHQLIDAPANSRSRALSAYNDLYGARLGLLQQAAESRRSGVLFWGPAPVSLALAATAPLDSTISPKQRLAALKLFSRAYVHLNKHRGAGNTTEHQATALHAFCAGFNTLLRCSPNPKEISELQAEALKQLTRDRFVELCGMGLDGNTSGAHVPTDAAMALLKLVGSHRQLINDGKESDESSQGRHENVTGFAMELLSNLIEKRLTREQLVELNGKIETSLATHPKAFDAGDTERLKSLGRLIAPRISQGVGA